jgi:phosphate transport system protein
MNRRLSREIDQLKARILAQSAEVEKALRLAVQAVADRTVDLARQVIAGDGQIDQAEVDIEEECLKLLALHQPVAIDLRFIVAVLKLNSDLERIGDLAVNIAERAIRLAEEPGSEYTFDFADMAARVQGMVRSALDALVNLDASLAMQVIAADDEVDSINRRMYQRTTDLIPQHPEHTARFIDLLGVSRLLERVSDHATNIAEDVVYLSSGDIIRHAWGLRRAPRQ